MKSKVLMSSWQRANKFLVALLCFCVGGSAANQALAQTNPATYPVDVTIEVIGFENNVPVDDATTADGLTTGNPDVFFAVDVNASAVDAAASNSYYFPEMTSVNRFPGTSILTSRRLPCNATGVETGGVDASPLSLDVTAIENDQAPVETLQFGNDDFAIIAENLAFDWLNFIQTSGSFNATTLAGSDVIAIGVSSNDANFGANQPAQVAANFTVPATGAEQYVIFVRVSAIPDTDATACTTNNFTQTLANQTLTVCASDQGLVPPPILGNNAGVIVGLNVDFATLYPSPDTTFVSASVTDVQYATTFDRISVPDDSAGDCDVLAAQRDGGDADPTNMAIAIASAVGPATTLVNFGDYAITCLGEFPDIEATFTGAGASVVGTCPVDGTFAGSGGDISTIYDGEDPQGLWTSLLIDSDGANATCFSEICLSVTATVVVNIGTCEGLQAFTINRFTGEQDPDACDCGQTGQAGSGDGTDLMSQVTVAVDGGAPARDFAENGFQPTDADYTVIAGVGVYNADGTPIDYSNGNNNGELTFEYGDTDADGDFDAAGPSQYRFFVIGDQPWTITFRDSEGCIRTVSGVCDVPNPSFTGLPELVCEDDPNFEIFDQTLFIGGATTVIGEFFLEDGTNDGSAGLLDNTDGTATFDPFIAGPGQHSVRYEVTFNEGINAGCTYSYTQIVTVLPSFNPEFELLNGALNPVTTVCAADADAFRLQLVDKTSILTLFQLFDNEGYSFLADQTIFFIDEEDIYIDWSGPGVTDLNDGIDAQNSINDGSGDATFDPAAAGVGNHTLFVTVGYPSCEKTFALEINVVDDVDPTINDLALCGEPNGNFPLTALFTNGTTPGGTFTVTSTAPTSLGAATINGDVLSYPYSADETITVNVRYAVGSLALDNANTDDPNQNTTGDCYEFDDATITINPGPATDFQLPTSMCSNATMNLAAWVTNGQGGAGSFELVNYTGLGDAGTVAGGTYTPAITTSGFVTFRFTQTTGTGCDVVGESVIRVLQGGDATVVASASETCTDDVTLTLADPQGVATTFTVVPTGFGTVTTVGNTVTFSPEAVTAPTEVTFTYTIGENTCLTTASTTVTVFPAVVLADDFTVCKEDAAIADLSALFTGNTPAGGTWTGMGVTSNVDATGTVWSFNATAAGDYTLTYTVGTSGIACLTDQVVITISDVVESNFTIETAIAGTDSLTEICSQDECYVIVPDIDPTVFDLGGTSAMTNGVGGGVVIPAALSTTLSFDYTSGADVNSYINKLSIAYSYEANAANAVGDHDGYTITGPGGVVIVNVGDNQDVDSTAVAPGVDNHFTVAEFVIVEAGKFVAPTVEAAYEAARLASMDPAAANMTAYEFFTTQFLAACSGDFVFDLTTNAASSDINLSFVEFNGVDPHGEAFAFLDQTNLDITDWAIKFEMDPTSDNYGYYYFCTRNEDRDIDLASFDEIIVEFVTSSCEFRDSNGKLCTDTSRVDVQILETPVAAFSADDFVFCATDGAIDLEQLLSNTATEGGVFAVASISPATAGTTDLDNNHLTVSLVDASATVTISYTVGDNNTCDPAAATKSFVVNKGVDASFTGVPETVCTGTTFTVDFAMEGGDVSASTFTFVGNTDGDYTVPVGTVGGTYTFAYTVTNGNCTETKTQEILVVESPIVTTQDNIVLCSDDNVINLTQFVSGTPGGTFSAADAGVNNSISGNIIFLNQYTVAVNAILPGLQQDVDDALVADSTAQANVVAAQAAVVAAQADVDNGTPGTIQYSIDSLELIQAQNDLMDDEDDATTAATNLAAAQAALAAADDIIYTVESSVSACEATGTFDITVLDAQGGTPTFDLAGSFCSGETVDLSDYLINGTPATGTFTATAGTINGTSYTAPEVEDNTLVTITYTIGAAGCESTYQQVIEITAPLDLLNAGTSFVCQSEDDFSINLTQYSANAGTGNGNLGGANFQLDKLRPFITEFDLAEENQCLEYVELSGEFGTDLNGWSLYFYERKKFDADDATVGTSSGAIYHVVAIGSSTAVTSAIPNADKYANTYQYINGSFNFDAAHQTNGQLISDATTALNGQQYATIVVDVNTGPTCGSNDDIMAGPAGIALVDPQGDVVQFIGYGLDSGNTNLGIFTGCDGPARGMVSTDINTVDAGLGTLQFTNYCWEFVPDVTPTPLYGTPAEFNVNMGPVFANNAPEQDNGTSTSADDGTPNILVVNEFYFDYIAPNGQILNTDRFCWSLFINGKEIRDEFANATDADEIDLAKNQVYPISFKYELFDNVCGSDTAVMDLVIFMDYEESWDLDIDEVMCANDSINLSNRINDDVHFITPYRKEGTFTATIDKLFDENMKPPFMSEIHYQYYDYDDFSADEHCVSYNYIDDVNNTPLDLSDDRYEQWDFCEGIEISAPVGTDLSCYALVFYTENGIDPTTVPNALGHDVIYMGENGLPIETDIADDKYMQLYGTVDNDVVGQDLGAGEILSVPENGNLDPFGNYPFFGGIDPINEEFQGNSPASFNLPGGLYVDNNNNGVFDPADTKIADDSFPWERDNNCAGDDVGSRWFPVLDIPNDATGVGLMNTCTGELREFLSWGEQLCVENEEDFTLAGPFQQLTSTVIDTTQNDQLGDLRSLQLLSCSELGLTGADCEICAEDKATVWAVVYEGGLVTVPSCGGITVQLQQASFSNSIGYYNCELDAAFAVDPYEFELDLTPLLDGGDLADLDPSVYDISGALPDHSIITGHTVEITIGTGVGSDFQVYQFRIASDNCEPTTEGYWDVTDTTNFSPNPCTGRDNACIFGEFVDPGLNTFQGGDDDAAAFPTGDGYYNTTFANGNGEDAPANNCYIDECTMKAKTVYYVQDIQGYIFDGNETDGDYINATTDSCQVLNLDPEQFLVRIKVNVEYEQCFPIGNFSTVHDDFEVKDDTNEHPQDPTATTTAHEQDGPVYLNCDDLDNPYWELVPTEFGGNDLFVTYEVTNANVLTNDPTDEVACLDDDNDDVGVRTQEIEVYAVPQAGFTADTIEVFATDGPVDLTFYFDDVTSGTGTFTGAGVEGFSFNPATVGTGVYTVDYTVATDVTNNAFDCEATATLVISVLSEPIVIQTPDGSIICAAGDAFQLEATPAGGDWTVDGVVVPNGLFTPTVGDTTVTATYTLFGSSESITINVYDPISIATDVSTDCVNGEYTVTLTLDGGDDTYTVNGSTDGIVGNIFTANIPSGTPFLFTVASPGACDDATSGTIGAPFVCPADCSVTEAGTLSLVAGATDVLCSTANLEVVAAGFNNATGFTQTYVLVDSEGNVIDTDPAGVFTAPIAGTYSIVGVNFATDEVAVPATLAEIVALAGNEPCFDATDAIDVTVLTEVRIVVPAGTAVCIDDTLRIEGFITGGAPEFFNFGSYDTNFGTVLYNANNTPAAPFMISLTNLPGGDFITISVSDDGNQCTSESVFVPIPADPCGLFAGNVEQNTFIDQPVDFNVLDNGQGIGVEVIDVIAPEDGILVWDANGEFTYTPAADAQAGDVITIIYQVQDDLGQVTTATATVTILAQEGAPLAVIDERICDNAHVTGEYTVNVTISGGVAPYQVFAGAFNAELQAAGTVSFDIPDGSGYSINVIDAEQTVKEITRNDLLPCTKVAVDLLVFTGEVQNAGNFVRWATATETDNDFFTVEHSTNGVDFTAIATIDGNGNASTVNAYNFLHKSAPAGVSYYRLSSTDFDGTVNAYNKVVVLTRGEVSTGYVNVFPVPATTDITVEFSSINNAPVRVEIYDIAGKLMTNTTVDAVVGANQTTINVNNFPVGSYVVRLTNGQNVSNTQFIKK